MTRRTSLASPIVLPLILATAWASACDDLEVAPDADVEAALEVGTGVASFTPVDDGEVFVLERGPQGAQHIYVALRTWGIDPRRARLELSLIRDRDGVTASQLDVGVTLRPVAGEPYAELAGLTLVLEEPDEVLDEALTLNATLTENAASGGRILSREHAIRVSW